jgi:protein phosphatase-4 regulatory subunit 3
MVLSVLHVVLTEPYLPVTLNDHAMYEHILDDDIFLGVVGMLECMRWLSLSKFQMVS